MPKAPEHYQGPAPVRIVERGVSGEDLRKDLADWRWERWHRAKEAFKKSTSRGGVVNAALAQERKKAKKK